MKWNSCELSFYAIVWQVKILSDPWWRVTPVGQRWLFCVPTPWSWKQRRSVLERDFEKHLLISAKTKDHRKHASRKDCTNLLWSRKTCFMFFKMLRFMVFYWLQFDVWAKNVTVDDQTDSTVLALNSWLYF